MRPLLAGLLGVMAASTWAAQTPLDVTLPDTLSALTTRAENPLVFENGEMKAFCLVAIFSSTIVNTRDLRDTRTRVVGSVEINFIRDGDKTVVVGSTSYVYKDSIAALMALCTKVQLEKYPTATPQNLTALKSKSISFTREGGLKTFVVQAEFGVNSPEIDFLENPAETVTVTMVHPLTGRHVEVSYTKEEIATILAAIAAQEWKTVMPPPLPQRKSMRTVEPVAVGTGVR